MDGKVLVRAKRKLEAKRRGEVRIRWLQSRLNAAKIRRREIREAAKEEFERRTKCFANYYKRR